MRVVVFTLIILAVFVISTFILNQYIDHSCDRLLENINGLHSSIEKNSWHNAKKQLVDLKEEWESVKKRWQLFLEHYEMDAIDITIARLDQYVDIEERALSLGEVAEFRLLISHIKDKERLKLENIL